MSHDGSTFPATATVTSGLINDIDLQGKQIVGTKVSVAELVMFCYLKIVSVLIDFRFNLE